MMIDSLKVELDKFWEWACMTREEYSQTPDFGDWETDYPNWSDIYCAADNAINLISAKKEYLQIEEIVPLLLEAIAIDNYNEKIIKDCQNILSHCPIFFEIAATHLQPEARRQVAELAGKIGDLRHITYLRRMADDEVNYVQRSALISMTQITPTEAEEIAYKKIKDRDEYIRLFSLKLLKKLDSSKLYEAIEVLKNDESEFIKQEIIQIKEYLN